MTPNTLVVAANNAGTIVSDFGATFRMDSAASFAVWSTLLILVACSFLFAMFFPEQLDSIFTSSRKRVLIACGGFLSTAFMVASLVSVVNAYLDVQPLPNINDPLDYIVYFSDAAEAEFGENVEVQAIEPGGEFASSARLPSESYDPDNEVYSGEVVVSDFSEVTMIKYDVTVDLDGTVTFTETANEESASSEKEVE